METCEDSGIMDLELDKTFGERKDQDGTIIDQGLTTYKQADYFKMNFVGSFSIDRDGIQLLIYQI